MTQDSPHDKIEWLEFELKQRGLAASEIADICDFVAYIEAVNAVAANILPFDLPLAYQPAGRQGKEG